LVGVGIIDSDSSHLKDDLVIACDRIFDIDIAHDLWSTELGDLDCLHGDGLAIYLGELLSYL